MSEQEIKALREKLERYERALQDIGGHAVDWDANGDFWNDCRAIVSKARFALGIEVDDRCVNNRSAEPRDASLRAMYKRGA